MPDAPADQPLLEALLDSWDRNNTILVNLLRALSEGGLEARAAAGSPSVAELFTHVRFVRIAAIAENAAEYARADAADLVYNDDEDWVGEHDPERIAQMLNDSAKVVRDAVKSYVESGRDMKGSYVSNDHPILVLQHMLWHEGYHLGQITAVL